MRYRVALVGTAEWALGTQVRSVVDAVGVCSVGVCAIGDSGVEELVGRADVACVQFGEAEDLAVGFIASLSSKRQPVRCLGVVRSFSKQLVRRIVEAGAWGIVAESRCAGGYGAAIRAVGRGRLFYPDHVLDRIFTRRGEMFLEPAADRGVVTLTSAEREMVTLVAAGRSNADAAESLAVTVREARALRSRVMRKTGSRGLAGLVRFAIRAGLADA